MNKKNSCRMCKSQNMLKFLDLGFSPPSDSFLTQTQLDLPEMHYPLSVFMCNDCGLCQLGQVVSKESMFNENYPYESSMTKSGVSHFTSMAIDICKKFNFPQGSLVIDVGSNVGVLLSAFKTQGMKVLGVEPSSNVAQISIKNGIDALNEFFSSKVALDIREQFGNASIITGTNVFAHVDDLDDFVKAVDILLSENGVLVIEAPYLVTMLDNLEYDTIYHEHLSYLSIKPMINFFNRNKMDVFNVEMQSIHGGSLRYFISRKGKYPISQSISNFLELEESKNIYSKERLEKFANDVIAHRQELNSFLFDLRKQGKRIVGISAPAKGNTLLNYCRIGPETLEYITEKSLLKIGKFTPGTHIPVYPDEQLLKDKPDYAVILAWNFADDIIKNNQQFKNAGGKFIIPIPHPRIV